MRGSRLARTTGLEPAITGSTVAHPPLAEDRRRRNPGHDPGVLAEPGRVDATRQLCADERGVRRHAPVARLPQVRERRPRFPVQLVTTCHPGGARLRFGAHSRCARRSLVEPALREYSQWRRRPVWPPSSWSAGTTSIGEDQDPPTVKRRKADRLIDRLQGPGGVGSGDHRPVETVETESQVMRDCQPFFGEDSLNIRRRGSVGDGML